eukprot:7116466-Pyramimonas_sp.AAC.1
MHCRDHDLLSRRGSKRRRQGGVRPGVRTLALKLCARSAQRRRGLREPRQGVLQRSSREVASHLVGGLCPAGPEGGRAARCCPLDSAAANLRRQAQKLARLGPQRPPRKFFPAAAQRGVVVEGLPVGGQRQLEIVLAGVPRIRAQEGACPLAREAALPELLQAPPEASQARRRLVEPAAAVAQAERGAGSVPRCSKLRGTGRTRLCPVPPHTHTHTPTRGEEEGNDNQVWREK